MASVYIRKDEEKITLEVIIIGSIIGYIAICFGKIAAKHGLNPILYGMLSVITPINLILLGICAFSKPDLQEDPAEKH